MQQKTKERDAATDNSRHKNRELVVAFVRLERIEVVAKFSKNVLLDEALQCSTCWLNRQKISPWELGGSIGPRRQKARELLVQVLGGSTGGIFFGTPQSSEEYLQNDGFFLHGVLRLYATFLASLETKARGDPSNKTCAFESRSVNNAHTRTQTDAYANIKTHTPRKNDDCQIRSLSPLQ